jgi:hypothetical protein
VTGLTSQQRRNRDGDGAYARALAASKRKGAVDQTDAELMAGVCDGTIQILCGGGVSARLVWEAAQARGMTTLELMAMANKTPLAVADMMLEAL